MSKRRICKPKQRSRGPLTLILSTERFNVGLIGDFAQLPPVDHYTPLYHLQIPTMASWVAKGRSATINFVSAFTLQQSYARKELTRTDRLQKPSSKCFHGGSYRGRLALASELGLSWRKAAICWQTLPLYDTRRSTYSESEGTWKVECSMGENQDKEWWRSWGFCSFLKTQWAKVMITQNIWQTKGEVNIANKKPTLGLVNATIGIIEDVIWAQGAVQSDLPVAVMVSCEAYTGTTLWWTALRPGFPEGIPIVPIVPLKTTFDNQSKTLSRTQLSLQLAWAVTIQKSQGLPLPKIRLGLGKREFSIGLTFVALSRVRCLDGIPLVESVDYSRVKKKAFSTEISRYRRKICTSKSNSVWIN